MRTTSRSWLFPVVTTLCAVALLAGCSGDDGTVSVGEGDDRNGSVDANADADADAVAYCDTAEQVIARSGELDLRTGGPETLADVERLAADAPAELAEEFDTFVTGIRGVAQLDPNDPAALSGILDLMLDPDFAAAASAIEEYTASQCGITLWSPPGPDGDDGATGEIGEFPGDGFEVEDVDSAMATLAEDGAAWVGKLSSTVVTGGNDVQVATSGDDLSDAEALAACTGLLTALSASDPDVSVSVANNETVLVTGSGGECAAA